MNRIQLPLSTVDVIALVGLACLAVGVGILIEPAAALVVIGAALLLYAVLASRSEVTP